MDNTVIIQCNNNTAQVQEDNQEIVERNENKPIRLKEQGAKKVLVEQGHEGEY